MNTPDLINGAFELAGAASLSLNVARLWRDRTIAGVHWASTVYFVGWGAWNLFYYPHLGQWASFAGGVAIMLANLVWLGSLAWVYRPRRLPDPACFWQCTHCRRLKEDIWANGCKVDHCGPVPLEPVDASGRPVPMESAR
jgi:hypothetical protein